VTGEPWGRGGAVGLSRRGAATDLRLGSSFVLRARRIGEGRPSGDIRHAPESPTTIIRFWTVSLDLRRLRLNVRYLPHGGRPGDRDCSSQDAACLAASIRTSSVATSRDFRVALSCHRNSTRFHRGPISAASAERAPICTARDQLSGDAKITDLLDKKAKWE
jgi:hypothetical protein